MLSPEKILVRRFVPTEVFGKGLKFFEAHEDLRKTPREELAEDLPLL